MSQKYSTIFTFAMILGTYLRVFKGKLRGVRLKSYDTVPSLGNLIRHIMGQLKVIPEVMLLSS